MKSLGECKSELRSIISELEDISAGIRRDFSGIGESHCADCLDSVIDRNEKALNRLNRVNPNRLAEWIMGDD